MTRQGRVFDPIDEWEKYIPEIEGEREAFVADPENGFSAEVRLLTARRDRAYDRIWQEAMPDLKKTAAAVEESAKRKFCNNVRNIRNYAPQGKLLETPEQVWEEGETVVINDFSEAIKKRSHLDKGLAKKLLSPSSGNTSAQKSTKGGGAQDVIPQSSRDKRQTQTMRTQSSGLTTQRNDESATATEKPTEDLRSTGQTASGVRRAS